MKNWGLVLFFLLILSACNLSQSSQTPEIVFKTAIPSQLSVYHDSGETSVQIVATQVPDPVIEHVREIVRLGQTRQNRMNVFSKVGDSITVSRGFMHPLGYNTYNLGQHTYLQAVIDFYQAENARTGNSFVNVSLAAGEGWAAWGVLDPELADKQICHGDSPLVCEYHIVRPAIAIIMFGTNDVGYRTEQEYRSDMNRIVDISSEMGVVPVLTTIPNRPDRAAEVIRFNDIIREIAREKQLPLIDFYELTRYLPNSGLIWDNVHPSYPPTGYVAAGNFSDINLQYGYTMRNLATLQALYSILVFLNA